MMVDVRHLVAISDLHVGSGASVCPDEVVLDNQGVYRPSVFQRWVNDRWRIFHDEIVPACTGGEPHILLINGDLIEGVHHGAFEPWTRDMDVQEQACIELLQPIVERAVATYIVRGTEAHDGNLCKSAERIGRELGSVRLNGVYTHFVLTIPFCGYVINAAHHIGTTTSAAYEAAAPNRELVATFCEAGQWGEQRPDLVIRSHRHRHSRVAIPTDDGEAQIVITPAWQLHTPYSHKVAVNRRAQIGGLVITAEPYRLDVRARVWAPKNEPVPQVGRSRRSTGTASSETLPKSTGKGSRSAKSHSAPTSQSRRPAARSSRKSAKGK